MKHSSNLILLTVLISLSSVAQDVLAQSREEFDAYAKRQREEFAKYKDERQAEFNRYREQYNREFAKYLRQAWKQVNPEEKVAPPPQPKPFVPKPVIDDDVKPLPVVPKQMPILEIVKPKTVPPAPKPIVIERPKEDRSQKQIRLESFYGNDFTLRCSEVIKISVADNSQSSIAEAWEKVATAELDPLVYDCQQAREEYNFCDWMYYLFVKEVAHVATQTAEGSNEETLLIGYILAQSGVDFRFARNDGRLLLALPFDTQIYKYCYFSVGGKNYYVVEKDVRTACYLMDRSFSKEASVLTLRISSPMNIGYSGDGSKVLASKKYPEMRVELAGNKWLMEFYHSYPRMDWIEYSLAPMSGGNTESIVEAFRPLIAGKSEQEAVNMILNFVQTAFTYGYDDEIWGGDRPFFADETLYYPYSDCEDRSILFSHLVRKLTAQDVVLLHYPNHLATAVRFSTDLPGDYVMVDGQKYLVCDPTGYKPIGNAYDKFKSVQAKVIKI